MDGTVQVIETWRLVDGRDDYEVSDAGRVRSLDRVVFGANRWGPGPRKLAGKLLTPYRAGKYLGVRFAMGEANRYIHRLVARAFVPNPSGLPQVNHKDGNKHNNAAANLEWVTASQNLQHSTRVLGNTAGQFKRRDGITASYDPVFT